MEQHKEKGTYVAKKEDTIKQIETAVSLIGLVNNFCNNYEGATAKSE